MNLEFAIPSENIIRVNPLGTVAVCTLWTSPEFVGKKLREEAPGLFEGDTPLALIGGLYGGGLKIMLRNLIHNPQIDTVLVYGKDYSGAGRHLKSFFMGRVERTGKKLLYAFEDGREEELEQVAIIGDESKYTMDGLILPASFQHPPAVITDLPFEAATAAPISNWLNSYLPPGPAEKKRVFIPLPSPIIETFPSDRAAHAIAANTIFEAWPKLLFRLSRFGERVTFRDGKVRYELLNMKVVIHNPGAYGDDDLKCFNIPLSEVEKYQDELLRPASPGPGVAYTYGRRLGAHFGLNTLEEMAKDLSLDKDSRRNVASVWDNRLDIQGQESPCLITLFFRKIEDRVNLTATFRSHNAAKAWPINCLGLAAVMRHVCGMANNNPGKTEPRDLKPGSMTVFSQSISINPGELEGVSGFIEDYKNKSFKPAEDPNGYFIITLDKNAREILVHHFDHENERLDEYRGRSASEVARLLYKNEAISDISHALYMGSQLERAWFCLENGLDYLQDKTKMLHPAKAYSAD